MEHAFLQAFRQYWQTHFSEWQPCNMDSIVAVSGGVDSIVLAYVLHRLGFRFVVAHCNFHLRGEESDRDESFVQQYAKSIAKPCVSKHFDTITFAKENKLSIEEAARELRYRWFRQLAEERKTGESPLPIFVAHHANDNVETVLMNFFRGCGIAGLHGILPIRDGIYRPLLFAKRNEIVAFALSEKLQWMEDSTNRDEKYTRNFLRHDILPELKTCFPALENNILENIQRLQEVEAIYTAHIAWLKKELLDASNGTTQINIAQLKAQNPLSTILYELFKDFGFRATQTSEIIKLLDAQTGARLDSDNYTIWKDREVLVVALKENIVEDIIVWNEQDDKLELPDGSFLIKNSQSLSVGGGIDQNNYWSVPPPTSKDSVQLDYDKLRFPLQVRHWRDGDVFYPTGMQGKKKLAKYFIDLKIPNPIKEKIWMLTSENNIVWIIGYRVDRRYAATEKSQMMKCELREL
ncbi:MAG: tRNA lysidine(34) synthetase TilS [Chitinophagaceae bacterium]